MLKKIVSIMVLTLALVFVSSQSNQAEAREVYVGTYSDGTAVYLLTESIRSNGRQGIRDYTCRVRAGRDYLNYNFYTGNTGWEYSNSEGYSGRVYDGSSPVAASILDYIRNNF